MGTKLITILAACHLFLLGWGVGSGHAAAKEILIVQGGTIAPFEEAIKGFEEATTALDNTLGIKSIFPSQLSRLILNSAEDLSSLHGKVTNRQPALLLAVGQKALDALGGIEKIPIVYLMAANPEALQSKQNNLTGIKLALSPERQLAALTAHLPAIRTVGVIYDPQHTAALIKEADKFLTSQSRRLLAIEATDPRQIAAILQTMNGKIDVLWMVPDRTAITSATLETIALYSMQTHIPVITFSEKYLQAGAMLAITSDPLAMGKQAALLANRIMQGAAVQKVTAEGPNLAKIITNEYVAEHLGPPLAGQTAGSDKNGRGVQP